VKKIFSFFFRKMPRAAFYLRFKSNYLGKMQGYPQFALWILAALAKIYFFPYGPNLAKRPKFVFSWNHSYEWG